MIIVIIALCAVASMIMFFWLIGYGAWAVTYLPGPKEDKDFLDYVTRRTEMGVIHWEVDKGKRSSHKGLKGKDVETEEYHKLYIHDQNSRFLRSYSMKGLEDDGFTFNKPQIASISIQPWRPMNRLVQVALKQVERGFLEPETTESVGLLFNLNWGEEPKWK